MRLRAIIQARVANSRLRGASLTRVAGSPRQVRVLDRLAAQRFHPEAAAPSPAPEEPRVPVHEPARPPVRRSSRSLRRPR